jgi:hypothetical protein
MRRCRRKGYLVKAGYLAQATGEDFSCALTALASQLLVLVVWIDIEQVSDLDGICEASLRRCRGAQ